MESDQRRTRLSAAARRKPAESAPDRFSALPRRIELSETVETKPASDPSDPDFGRNPETEWLIRYCA